jgi:excisionase family DNA binding protein
MKSLNGQGSEPVITLNKIEIISIPIHSTGVYTFSEAAELSKCSYSTIRRAVDSGNLDASYIGNQPRIIGAKLLAWIESGGATGRSKATMP